MSQHSNDKRESDNLMEELLRELKDSRVDVNVIASTPSGSTGFGSGSYTSQLMLPRLEEDDDIESFIATLERVMGRKGIEEDGWLDFLTFCMSGAVRKDMENVLTSDDCSYAVVVEALLARGGIDPRAA